MWGQLAKFLGPVIAQMVSAGLASKAMRAAGAKAVGWAAARGLGRGAMAWAARHPGWVGAGREVLGMVPWFVAAPLGEELYKSVAPEWAGGEPRVPETAGPVGGGPGAQDYLAMWRRLAAPGLQAINPMVAGLEMLNPPGPLAQRLMAWRQSAAPGY